MSANIAPLFFTIPNTFNTVIATASAARDGSGTITTCFTATASFSVVNKITIQNATTAAVGTSNINIARIYISDTSGLNYRIYKEIYIHSVVMGNATIGGIQFFEIDNGLYLKAGQQIGVSMATFSSTSLDKYNITVEGADY